jgi:hypothetical protein
MRLGKRLYSQLKCGVKYVFHTKQEMTINFTSKHKAGQVESQGIALSRI